MRILFCHNYYQKPGGEDRCFEDEAALLESHGHTVVRYQRDNDHIKGIHSIATAGLAIWNRTTIREIRQIIRDQQIDLVHCMNAFPVISPSLYYACHRENIPVVQTLANYRLFCAGAYFMRDQKVCEDCIGKIFPWPAIAHGCYRESRTASTAVTALQVIHRLIGTWSKRVTRYIALTEFGREKFIQCGLPAERIAVKPNFVDPIPAVGSGEGDDAGHYALFVGRLSPEKGVELMLEAWQDPACSLPLMIVGDGPLADSVRQAAANNPRIRFIGQQPPEAILGIMAAARFLVFPSVWYEGLPRTIVESLAVGTPILAADIGAMTEIVTEGAGGLRFPVGDLNALRAAAIRLCQNPELTQQMRSQARAEFLAKYTADENYRIMINIYNDAIAELVSPTNASPRVREA